MPAPWVDDTVEYCDQCLKVPKSFPFCFFFSSKYTIYCGRFCTNNALRHAKLKYSAGKTFPRLNFHEFSALFVAVYL